MNWTWDECYRNHKQFGPDNFCAECDHYFTPIEPVNYWFGRLGRVALCERCYDEYCRFYDNPVSEEGRASMPGSNPSK